MSGILSSTGMKCTFTPLTQKNTPWGDGTNGGILAPVSEGQRVINVHAGSKNGFTPNALLIFISRDTIIMK
jgi:hypothetical protein